MEIPAEHWPLLSRLLDEALELEPEAREHWFATLAPPATALAGPLRVLLKSLAEVETNDFLGALPDFELTGGDASGMEEEQSPAGTQIGPYVIEAEIGRGGMGIVWRARRQDGQLKRPVALKLPRMAVRDRDLLARFARERDILSALEHPNIARLYDAGTTADGQVYLALEYVEGETLTVYAGERRLGVAARLGLFRQVLDAVSYAHQHLTIHRDLKPSNILVNADGQVRLLDFGVAKLLPPNGAADAALTEFGAQALTPEYAAPEQVKGHAVTTATDVYALGVLLYELLTGSRPYPRAGRSRGSLESAIVADEPRRPSQAIETEREAEERGTTAARLRALLKKDLDAIILKAIKKSPNERFATCDAFAADIDNYLAGRPVSAQPDRAWYRTVKFARRNWIALAAASVLIVTLAGGLAATSYEAEVASAQRDAAVRAQLRLLTKTAAARLTDNDVPGAMGIILEVLQEQGADQSYTPEALSVFQEARAGDLQVLAMTGHTDTVRSAVFSPDGRRLATASDDNTARLWDASTGRQVMLLSGHSQRVISVAFSPTGQRIVTASADKTARVWDATTGHEILRLSGHSDRVLCAAYSPDGRRIVTASSDKTARVWDAESGREVTVLLGHTDVVHCATFSPDSTRVVTASLDKSARIWDAGSGRELVKLVGHLASVFSAAYSGDGARIVTAAADRSARIWDAASGRQLLRLSGHTSLFVNFAAFAPNGRQVVTASDDDTARVWDADTGEQQMLLSAHTIMIHSASFSPDGNRIVSASDDKTARIWDTTGAREIVRLIGHKNAVYFGTFSPDGRRVITASGDRTARIWDAVSGQEVLTLSGHTDEVLSAVFSRDGRQAATASADKTVRIWDAESGKEILLLRGHTQGIMSAAFSPDGQYLATASNDKTARIWNTTTGQQVLILNGHTNRVFFATFSPDGRHLATTSADKTTRIWNSATGKQEMILSGHTDAVNSAAFSPDGRRMVTASGDNTARIWDRATGKQELLLTGHSGSVASAVFTPDGQRIITTSSDGTARIWDALGGRQIWLLNGHTAALEFAGLSPDGRRLVTPSDDGTALIWDTSSPPLDVQIGWANAAQFEALSGADRIELGLSDASGSRRWPANESTCDGSAAAPYDTARRAPGVLLEQIVPDIAIAACADDTSGSYNRPQVAYQRARALMAGQHYTEARRGFEAAITAGYRAAQVDLAMLVSQPSAAMLDVPMAISLYERAWRDGTTIAAYELGAMYEYGVSAAGDAGERILAPDQSRAWLWYSKGAEAGEPNALARLADKADAQAATVIDDTAERLRFRLQAFKYYAAAAERARREDWPDEAWRNIRYRRASLARLLARDGKMQETAEAYLQVLNGYATPAPSGWERLITHLMPDH